jgi:hypothetical protein
MVFIQNFIYYCSRLKRYVFLYNSATCEIDHQPTRGERGGNSMGQVQKIHVVVTARCHCKVRLRVFGSLARKTFENARENCCYFCKWHRCRLKRGVKRFASLYCLVIGYCTMPLIGRSGRWDRSSWVLANGFPVFPHRNFTERH